MKFAKYNAVFKTTILETISYKWDILLEYTYLGIILFVLINLWITAFTFSNTSNIAGYTLSGILLYLVVTESIIIASPDIIRDTKKDIQTGVIANTLNKPINFLVFAYSKFMATITIKFTGGLILALILLQFYVTIPTITPFAIIALLITLLFAFSLDFLFKIIIGMSGFWLEETNAIAWVYSKIIFIIGGAIIPIEFFPNWIQPTIKILPFNLLTWAPAKLTVAYSNELFVQILTMQIFWVTVLVIISTLIFKAGTKKLIIMGG